MGEDTVYWVWLNELRGLPNKTKRKLLTTFETPEAVFQASLTSIQHVLSKKSPYPSHADFAVAETPKEMAFASVWTKRTLSEAETILNNNEHKGIHVLRASDEHYRPIFTTDQQTPLVLYYRGTIAPPSVPIVGVIGSRSCTPYGQLVTKAAVATLVEKGNIIASGLSFGIDALAHETTLECNGRTYAFLPCGLHKAQPASHTQLMERIADTGAVITPYAYGKAALPFRFIGRNSLLASWCTSLLVIEARSESGSMNTAKNALSKGKQVFAVPNSLLEPQSSGTNHLLSIGAHVYLNDHLLAGTKPEVEPSDLQEEHSVIKALHNKGLTTAELRIAVGFTTLFLLETLNELELTGKIKFRSDGKWHTATGA
ncbi:MAG: DNA-processing protein DprA [Sphaerochaeta sp.]